MIVVLAFIVGGLLLVGGVVATMRERTIEWRAFGGAIACLIAAAALEALPYVLD